MTAHPTKISDDQILDVLRTLAPEQYQHTNTYSVQQELGGDAAYPLNVVHRKLSTMLRRKVIEGCACGCHGSWGLLDDDRP